MAHTRKRGRVVHVSTHPASPTLAPPPHPPHLSHTLFCSLAHFLSSHCLSLPPQFVMDKKKMISPSVWLLIVVYRPPSLPPSLCPTLPLFLFSCSWQQQFLRAHLVFCSILLTPFSIHLIFLSVLPHGLSCCMSQCDLVAPTDRDHIHFTQMHFTFKLPRNQNMDEKNLKYCTVFYIYFTCLDLIILISQTYINPPEKYG